MSAGCKTTVRLESLPAIRRDDIALANSDTELDPADRGHIGIRFGHAALPLRRATRCIDNNGKFDQQSITRSF
jgi:hypothetical protein